MIDEFLRQLSTIFKGILPFEKYQKVKAYTENEFIDFIH